MGRAYEVRKAAIQKNGAQKAKLYSNFAKEIYIAAKNGGTSLEANEKLKQLVDKAKEVKYLVILLIELLIKLIRVHQKIIHSKDMKDLVLVHQL